MVGKEAKKKEGTRHWYNPSRHASSGLFSPAEFHLLKFLHFSKIGIRKARLEPIEDVLHSKGIQSMIPEICMHHGFVQGFPEVNVLWLLNEAFPVNLSHKVPMTFF